MIFRVTVHRPTGTTSSEWPAESERALVRELHARGLFGVGSLNDYQSASYAADSQELPAAIERAEAMELAVDPPGEHCDEWTISGEREDLTIACRGNTGDGVQVWYEPL